MLTKPSINCVPTPVSLEMSELYKMGLGADALRQQVLDDLALAQRLTLVLAALEASGKESDEPTVRHRVSPWVEAGGAHPTVAGCIGPAYVVEVAGSVSEGGIVEMAFVAAVSASRSARRSAPHSPGAVAAVSASRSAPHSRPIDHNVATLIPGPTARRHLRHRSALDARRHAWPRFFSAIQLAAIGRLGQVEASA
jgi:hypothetical protein